MRRNIDIGVKLLAGTCALISLLIIGSIIIAIAWRGYSAISWDFLAQNMREAGASGGIFYNIIGTLVLISTGLTVSVPCAMGLGLAYGVYVKSPKGREYIWISLTVLSSIPAILFGLFGLALFVKFLGWGKSWLAGGIVLGFMMLPTVAVAFCEKIKALPSKYIEAATGLGLNQTQVVLSVILPQCAGGIVTGSLLGLARIAGETAPIMFTATVFAGATLPDGIKENPVLSLPYHIFILAQDSFDPAAGAKIWGAALVLLAIVLTFSLLAFPARLKIHEEARH